MLFAFRGVRMYQVLLAGIALAMGIGATLSLKVFVDSRAVLMLPVAILLTLIFFWSFAGALRAPTSFVAVAEERTRIRFPGCVDTVIENRDILAVRLVRRNILGGIGVRTNFGGDVALVTTWGNVVELTLRRPLRVWLIPRLVPLKAERLTLSLKNPQKLVERFGPSPATVASAPSNTADRKPRQRGSRTR